MPTPEPTMMGRVVDAVESVSVLSPTTALLLGVLIGACLGVGAVVWLKRKQLGLQKEEKLPPV